MGRIELCCAGAVAGEIAPRPMEDKAQADAWKVASYAALQQPKMKQYHVVELSTTSERRIPSLSNTN